MSGEDGQCPVDLFGEDDTRELVGQRDAAKRKKQVRALTSPGGPAVSRSDRENQTLSSVIAQSAELLSEFFRGEQLASTVEQNNMRRSTTRLTIEPLKQCRLGLKELRVAGGVTSRPIDVVREQTISRIGLRATAPWCDRR